MKIKLSLLAFFFVTFSFAFQFQLSNDAEVSVLTFGPGKSLNDAFGHNAFRIKDKTKGIDIVYGYGQYDFDAPNFYLKFARGKLNYLISRHFFSDIFSYYSRENRTIKEQFLNLSIEQKQKLFNYLEHNYKPENRKYLYDFFYDNCATKIRDVLSTITDNSISFEKPNDFEQRTFRDLIYEHVDKNSWGSLGIDIALGSVVDREASANEYMFLPKYIYSFFEVSKINGNANLVKSSSILFKSKEEDSTSGFLLSPFIIFGLLSFVILFITFKDNKNGKQTKWLDISIFALTGLTGILLLFLWFGTDHTATWQNYNLLWAFPINVLIIGQLLKKDVRNWGKSYLKFLIIMLCLLTLHWIIEVQVFAITLIPLLIALAVRYVYLVKFFSSKTKVY
jgi:heme/copper-type cytochrome/quinol oxidase subunit 4